MRRSVVLCLAIACGPGDGSDDSAGDGGGTVTMTLGGEDAASMSSTADTTGSENETGDRGAEESTAADPDGTTGPDATDGTTGGAACEDPSSYRGVFIPGGLDRIRLYRRSDEENTCYWMTLVSPLEMATYEAEVTAPWVLQEVFWNMSAPSCDELDPAGAGANMVPDATGTITLEAGPSGAPCTAALDLDLQLLQNPDPPVFVPLCQESIALEGC